MKIKSIFLTLFLLFSFSCESQNFELAKPNVKQLKEQLKDNSIQEIIYSYLINNYNILSEKFDVKNYNYPDYDVCSFKQNFQNEIIYSEEKCKEAGGITIEVIFPKTKKENLIHWVESIFKSYSMDIEHKWNSNRTKFEPSDKGVGCYFEITQTNKKSKIYNYCGC